MSAEAIKNIDQYPPGMLAEQQPAPQTPDKNAHLTFDNRVNVLLNGKMTYLKPGEKTEVIIGGTPYIIYGVTPDKLLPTAESQQTPQKENGDGPLVGSFYDKTTYPDRFMDGTQAAYGMPAANNYRPRVQPALEAIPKEPTTGDLTLTFQANYAENGGTLNNAGVLVNVRPGVIVEEDAATHAIRFTDPGVILTPDPEGKIQQIRLAQILPPVPTNGDLEVSTEFEFNGQTSSPGPLVFKRVRGAIGLPLVSNNQAPIEQQPAAPSTPDKTQVLDNKVNVLGSDGKMIHLEAGQSVEVVGKNGLRYNVIAQTQEKFDDGYDAIQTSEFVQTDGPLIGVGLAVYPNAKGWINASSGFGAQNIGEFGASMRPVSFFEPDKTNELTGTVEIDLATSYYNEGGTVDGKPVEVYMGPGGVFVYHETTDSVSVYFYNQRIRPDPSQQVITPSWVRFFAPASNGSGLTLRCLVSWNDQKLLTDPVSFKRFGGISGLVLQQFNLDALILHTKPVSATKDKSVSPQGGFIHPKGPYGRH